MSQPVSRKLLIGGLVALASLTPLAMSCDQLVEQLTASDFAVAVLLSTPAVPNPKNAGATLPGVTTLSVFVGATDTTKILDGKASADAISPESDATVTVDFTNTTTNMPVQVSVPSKGNGIYAVTSTDSVLVAQAGTAYTVTISRAGKTYKLKATSSVDIPKIKEFEEPAPRLITDYDAAANGGFTITRDPSLEPTSKNKVAFVAMQAIDSNTTASATPGGAGITNTNIPTTPFGFLELVLDKSKWQEKTFTIPADKFAAATPYLVSLTAVSEGSNPTDTSSSALFAGSNFFIGTADAGGVVTK